MARQYVSDLIGDDYKNWKCGDNILITTPTGSGKTTFILRVLLKYAKERNKHIVYFCNRRFLKLQFESSVKQELLNELGEDKEGLSAYLHIRTYQHTEKHKDFPDLRKIDKDGKTLPYGYEVTHNDVLYYIFDEAHYFIEDAEFNIGTKYWYEQCRKLVNHRDYGISIFLTATPEPLYIYLFVAPMNWMNKQLEDYFRDFVASYFVSKNIEPERWLYFLSSQYQGTVNNNSTLPHLGMPSPPLQMAANNMLVINSALKDSYIKQHFDSCKIEFPYYRQLSWIIESAYVLDTCPEAYNINHLYKPAITPKEYYKYIDEHYFANMAELVEPILNGKKSDEKWLIFVRTTNEGKYLQELLDAGQCPSVMITAEIASKYDGEPKKRRSKERKTFDDLVLHRTLACRVLISTSVLDCGISLHAENVNNIVICQPNKTSFLQMLGRIRVKEGEKINLFIQSITSNQIKGHIHKYQDRFIKLVQLAFKDEEVPAYRFPYNEDNSDNGDDLGNRDNGNDSGSRDNSDNSSHTINVLEILRTTNFYLDRDDSDSSVPFLLDPKMLDHILSDKDLWKYMVNEPTSSYSHSSAPQSRLRVNMLALLNHLAVLYHMEMALAEDKEPYYFLKEQLSWIGKEYDPSRWIGQSKALAELQTYLEQLYDSQKLLNQDEQRKLREDCFTILSKTHDTLENFSQSKKWFDSEGRNLPGKNIYNSLFQVLGIPFRIKSKQPKFPIRSETGQKMGIDHKTYWKIERVSLDYSEKNNTSNPDGV